ncbi:7-deoxyloganetin glucosyltransferase [Sarracenia purpurea var. burkii]
MGFSVTAGEELGIPVVLFYTISACSFMGFYQFRALLQKGLVPLKDESYLTNGYLDTVIDWIPGMKDIRLKDLPSYVRSTDPNDINFNFCMKATERSSKASAIILHTFDALESDVLNALKSTFSSIYAIGPQQLLLNQILKEDQSKSIGYNLWKEESECLEWLNSREPDSVIYVNFGSITVMTPQQLEEFGWGLANSHHSFLWIIRPDLVIGAGSSNGSIVLSSEFMTETKERGLMASWCSQEEVLNHPSIKGFLTHCGWNSIIESLSTGVPMICWPYAGDQPTNCRYLCNEWGFGMEIDVDVKREGVEKVVREIMGGEKGEKMKNKAKEWRKLAVEATSPGGSATSNLDNLVNKLLVLGGEGDSETK